MADKTTVHIFGLLTSIKFYKLKYLAMKYQKKQKPHSIILFTDVYFETEWEEFIKCQKRLLCGEAWCFDDSVMTFVNGLFTGGYSQFVSWFEKNAKMKAIFPETFLHDSVKEMRQRIRDRDHKYVYMQIKTSCLEGILIFELYTNLLPKTCQNFISLCTGEAGKASIGCKLHYKNSLIHRVVPGGWIQGGDIVKGSGNNGYSIYGPTFPDESFTVSHDRFGILGMANKGPHSNASQFYITLGPHVWMNGKVVAFGQLISGRSLLEEIAKLPTVNERPMQNTYVTDCGVYSTEDIQILDLTEDDLVLFYSVGVDLPNLPVTINLPSQFMKCVDDAMAMQSK